MPCLYCKQNKNNYYKETGVIHSGRDAFLISRVLLEIVDDEDFQQRKEYFGENILTCSSCGSKWKVEIKGHNSDPRDFSMGPEYYSIKADKIE